MSVPGNNTSTIQALRKILGPPGENVLPLDDSPTKPHFLQMYAPGKNPRPGSFCTDDLDMDSHWHFHDMHQLIYAFESAIEVEVLGGRHLIPRQIAVWIPAGVTHRASFHRVHSASVFFTKDMVKEPGNRIRAFFVSPLIREMIRECLRWPLYGPDDPLRSLFFDAMAGLCEEWVKLEADLFLPTSEEPRIVRALEYTTQRMDVKLSDVCQHAGMSERTLRRCFKAELGMTWESYRQRSRLLQGVSLLSETDTAIAEIAAQCGFESPSAFARAFRSIMHETPREYRNRVKNG